MLRLVSLLLALASAAAAGRLFGLEQEVGAADQQLLKQFGEFVVRHDKTYSGLAEARERFEVYKSNQWLMRMAAAQERGSAQFGDTRFADLTREEFRARYLTARPRQAPAPGRELRPEELKALRALDTPKEFDWRAQGLVAPVKDQKDCGACWAFSVAANVEGQWKKKKGQLLSLSEQHILDCDKVDKGCAGGWPLDAYKELVRLGGLESEQDYPYLNADAQCKQDDSKLVAYINGSVKLPQDEEAIKQYLFAHGPLSVAVDADWLTFYHKGVHHPWKFFCQGLNHAVLLVGWGEEHGKPFWLIKNSWGPRWGEQGYFRLHRGDDACGVAEYVTSALVDEQ